MALPATLGEQTGQGSLRFGGTLGLSMALAGAARGGGLGAGDLELVTQVVIEPEVVADLRLG
jgi:hypothetical protein